MSLAVLPILDGHLSVSQKPPHTLAQFDRTDIFREAYCKVEILEVTISCVG